MLPLMATITSFATNLRMEINIIHAKIHIRRDAPAE